MMPEEPVVPRFTRIRRRHDARRLLSTVSNLVFAGCLLQKKSHGLRTRVSAECDRRQLADAECLDCYRERQRQDQYAALFLPCKEARKNKK